MNADSSAYTTGYLIGQFFWPMIALIVIIYQVQKLKVADRSRFAAFALILWALSFFIIVVATIFAKRMVDFQLQRLVLVVVGLVWLVLQTGSFICAGVGAYETFRRKRRLTGRNLVVWSLLLGLLFSGVYGFAAYQGIRKNLGLDTAYSSMSDGLESSKSGDGYSVELKDFNMGVDLTGPGWSRLNPEEFNPEISLWLMNRKERLNFIIIAEPLGTSFEDLAVFEEVIKAGMKPEFESITFTPFETKTIDGRTVRYSKAVGKMGINVLEYRIHLFMENGCLYQVNVFTNRAGGFEGADDYVDELLSGFYLLDSEQFLGMDSELRRSAFELPEFGFRLEFPEANWMIWEDLAVDAPSLMDGALYPSGGAIGVMATSDFDADERIEVIAEAFFHAMDLDLDYLDYEKVDGKLLGELEAEEYRFSQMLDGGMYEYCMRFAKSGPTGIAVVGWWASDDAKLPVLAAFDEVQVNLPESMPAASGDSELRANVLNAAGLAHYEESRYGKAASYFKRAYEQDREMWVALQNVALAAQYSEDYESAIRFIEPEYEKFKGKQDLTICYGLLLLYSGEVEQGFALVNAVFSDGYVDDDDLLTAINLLIDAEEYDRAVEVCRSGVEGAPSLKREAWLTSVMRIAGDLEAAKAYLKIVKEKYGDAPLLAQEEVELLLEESDSRGALERIEEWIAVHGASVDATELKITAQLNLNWLADAKTTVSEALEENPGNESLLESKRWILSRIGEDDLNLIRQPIAPVAMPKKVAQILDEAVERPEQAAWQDKSSIYDYRATLYHFDASQPMRTSTLGRVQLKDRAALEEFATLRFEFDRSYERMYINYIRVLDEDGVVVGELERDSVYISENSDQEMATDSVAVYAPVASLKVGSTLEWQTSWETNGIEDTFPFKNTVCVATAPRKERVVCVSGDLDAIMTRVEGVEEVSDGADSDYIAWRIQDTQSFHLEQNMPDLADFLPHVMISSKESSWENIAEDYYQEIEDYLEPDAEIEELVAGLKLEKLSDQEKVVQMVRFVQEQVVYKALEFGSRGTIPEQASQTWKNRYGDCKDQTVLLLQMLASIGMESYPLLVSTGSQVVEAMPSMDQFNHMILYVPALEQPFVDVVDNNFDFGYGTPSGLGDAKGLVVARADSRILTLPAYEFSLENPIADLKTVIGKGEGVGGELAVQESLTLRGYYAMWIRSRFRDLDRERYDHAIRDYLNRYLPSGARFVGTGIEHVDDLSQPLTLKVSYDMPLATEEIEYRPLWEQFYLDMEPSATRLSPYRIRYPFSLKSTVQVVSAVSLGLSDLKPLASEKSDLVRFSHQSEALKLEDDASGSVELGVVTYFGWPAMTLSPAEYFQYYTELDRFKELALLRIQIQEPAGDRENSDAKETMEVVVSE